MFFILISFFLGSDAFIHVPTDSFYQKKLSVVQHEKTKRSYHNLRLRSLFMSVEDDNYSQLDHDSEGYTSDDALSLWSKGCDEDLKNLGIKVTPGMVADSYENKLYPILVQFSKHDDVTEDRVLWVYQNRGSLSRYYTILGRNSNGLPLSDYQQSLNNSIRSGILVAVVEFMMIGFFGSGDFSYLLHQIMADGAANEVIATTGLLSLFSSKVFEWCMNNGAKGLNPWWHFETYRLLSIPVSGEDNIRYTKVREPIFDVISDRLDGFYHGTLKEGGGLNPEYQVTLADQRAKSDQNEERQLKLAVRLVLEKRSKLWREGSQSYLKEKKVSPKFSAPPKEINVYVTQNFYPNTSYNTGEVIESFDNYRSIKNKEEFRQKLIQSIKNSFLEENLNIEEKDLEAIISSVLNHLENIENE
ncbi:MAG: hypothetical protein CMP11_04205 [Zetaproteobacteria bacterium]|nr:hypothetical protein [Pseudobdellovibrionaceae bacterium]|tara:strand:+ start:384 stop:1628 length:1245 start_codon:yes stop_codon:yes gene_type:complete